MWCLQYPICITRNSWHSVDTQLTVNFWMGPWPYNFLFSQWWLVVRWLQITQVATPKVIDTLLTLCWRCADAVLTLSWCWLSGVAIWSLTILPIKAANTSIIDNSCTTAPGWHKIQHPKSLTLCWRSFSDWGCDHVAFSFAHKGGHYVDYG